jgi:PTS system cellobiose-specific IIA component
MSQSEWEQTLFTVILHAGNARSSAKEAQDYAVEGDWKAAQASIDEANDEVVLAHKSNVGIIQREAKGEKVEFSVLLVHALDLLVLAWSEIDFAEQFLKLNKRIAALEDRASEG